MAKSNRERVEEALTMVATGFGRFVDDQMSNRYGDAWIAEVTSKGNWAGSKGGQLAKLTDADFVLWVAGFEWQSVFRKILGQTERGLIGELRDARGSWAHNDSFTIDSTYRILDSAFMLLKAVSAPEADQVDAARTEVMRVKFEQQTRKTVAVRTTSEEGREVAGLTPWREVVQPHDDVAMGTFQQAEFAADLHKVAQGIGLPEYTDPVEFFRRTFLTGGLRKLLVHTAQRVTGTGGDPIINLLTQFGGGKTHSLLAVFHLVAPGVQLSDLPGVDELLKERGIEALPTRIRRAVLVGNRISPGRADVKEDGTEVNTLWGALAWQLGGREAYDMLEGTDTNRTNPGDRLDKLFDKYAPLVVLIDEWVAYTRQIWDRTDLPSGDFETHMSFAQALTEAAKTPGVLLAVSVPSSDVEVGGDAGKKSLERIRKVVERTDSPWQPASAEEGFEIVRRRLFKPLDAQGYKQRDVTARRFVDYYASEAAEFPTDCAQRAYEERIKAAYPIHPELFDRLYQDWSTLERFQRTRGVLRLMASVVHALWARGDRSPLVLPGGVPIDDTDVFEEVTRYLEDNWKPIVDKDVDGSGSVSVALDAEVPALGKNQAARRVARTVFLGSAPTATRRDEEGRVVDNPNRGIEDLRIKLGTSMPGESPSLFGDALRRLSSRANHLYVDSSRYWFSVSPSINRTAKDRAERYADDEIIAELVRLVKDDNPTEGSKRGDFSRVHILPSASIEVEDEPAAGLVVLRPEVTHGRKDSDSAAVGAAREFVKQRGAAPRTYQNMLVFLAADESRLPELLQAVRDLKAWTSILNSKDELNLDQRAIAQAATRRDQERKTVSLRINETFCWLINPSQELEGDLRLPAVKINNQGTLAERASKKVATDNSLVRTFGSTMLRYELDRVPLWRGDHVSVRQAWEDFASFPYLPRLRDLNVFLRAVSGGPQTLDLANDGFAYAEAWDGEAKRYRGLVVTGGVPNPVADGLSVLVRPAVASAVQAELENRRGDQGEPADHDRGTHPAGIPDDGRPDAGETRVVRPTRFYGRVTIADPSRLGRDAGDIGREILANLLPRPGVTVRVTIELEGDDPNGFDEATVRTLSENARELGFETSEFE